MDAAEQVAVVGAVGKQCFVDKFHAVVVLVEGEKIIVYQTVDNPISEKSGILAAHIIALMAHVGAYFAEKPQRPLLKSEHEIAAHNQIHLIGLQFVVNILVNAGGDKKIAVVIFDFRALLAAQNIFQHQFVNVIGRKRGLEQIGIVDADKMQPVDFFTLRPRQQRRRKRRVCTIGRVIEHAVFCGQIIGFGIVVGGVHGLVHGLFGHGAGVAARGGIITGMQRLDNGMGGGRLVHEKYR